MCVCGHGYPHTSSIMKIGRWPLSPTLLLGSGGVWPWPDTSPFQREGGEEAMISALLFLGSGGDPKEWGNVP